ncbi:MAG: PDZ domain-containing protein [Planctomycetes bacterium]|nr:PDZ domain-containing protein [Planctomycetota bacterium]
MIVASVITDSPAEIAGLQEGDPLLKIDGESANQWDIGRLKEMIRP